MEGGLSRLNRSNDLLLVTLRWMALENVVCSSGKDSQREFQYNGHQSMFLGGDQSKE